MEQGHECPPEWDRTKCWFRQEERMNKPVELPRLGIGCELVYKTVLGRRRVNVVQFHHVTLCCWVLVFEGKTSNFGGISLPSRPCRNQGNYSFLIRVIIVVGWANIIR